MSKEIVVTYEYEGKEVKLTPEIVRDYLTGGVEVTLPEFKLFSELCRVRGLNPFLKEAYIIKYGNNPAQVVVGKDAILKRAILHKQFDGREQGVIVLNADGVCVEKNGTFTQSNEVIVGGWAKVYRKDWSYPVYITVTLDEVAQTKRDGSYNKNWSTKTGTMVEKVALVRALREAFVEEIGGMYEADEVGESVDTTNDLPDVQQDTLSDDSQDVEENIIDIEDI